MSRRSLTHDSIVDTSTIATLEDLDRRDPDLLVAEGLEELAEADDDTPQPAPLAFLKKRPQFRAAVTPRKRRGLGRLIHASAGFRVPREPSLKWRWLTSANCGTTNPLDDRPALEAFATALAFATIACIVELALLQSTRLVAHALPLVDGVGANGGVRHLAPRLARCRALLGRIAGRTILYFRRNRYVLSHSRNARAPRHRLRRVAQLFARPVSVSPRLTSFL